MFITPENDLQRVPVALLSGFLGSGKTTLVNALLRDARLAETAVAVNEFGEIPLDGHLIDGSADRVITLANGCLCCNTGGDMEEGVMRLFTRREAGAIGRFARLIIEPSGLADPAPIAQAILRNPVMSRVFRLETIICTVDALFAEQHFLRFAETRKQAALADRIVITKPDLVDAATLQRVHACLRDLNPLAPVVEAVNGAADPGTLFPESFLSATGDHAVPARRSVLFADDAAVPSHSGSTVAVCLSADTKLDWRTFEAWLRDLRIAHADQLLRIKGVLDVAGSDAPVAIHGIHHVLHAPVQLAGWPDGLAGTRIVMITRDLAAGTIERSWDEFRRQGKSLLF